MTEQTENVGEEKKDTTEEVVPTTQVVSIDREEAKTGQKFELPPAEVIAQNAMKGYIKGMQDLHKLITDGSTSKISVAKGVLAGLDLPEEDIPVFLKTPAEREIFATVQTVVNCRYLVTQYHIDLRRKEMLALKQAEESKTTETTTEETKVPEQTQTQEGVPNV